MAIAAYAELIGFAAAACTTFSFLPQTVRCWRTRSAKDFSWWMLGLFVVGTFLWLIYGIMVSDLPVIIANAATELLVLSLVAAKLKFG